MKEQENWVQKMYWTTIHVQLRSVSTKSTVVDELVNIYYRAIPSLGRGFNEKSQTGLRDMATHIRLCHATVSPDLDQFYLGEVASTGKYSLERWLEKYKEDNEASMFWTWTRPASKLDPPGNRDEYAHATLADSVKICFLIHLLYHICIKQKRKCIVFCEWPFTQWLVEIALQNLGLGTVVIRAKTTTKETTRFSTELPTPLRAVEARS